MARRAPALLLALLATLPLLLVPAPASADGIALIGRLPYPLSGASAVWSGTHAYLFGGQACGPQGCDTTADIVRFDPATGESRVMLAKLPTGRAYTAAVWTGSEALIFGGARTDGWDGFTTFATVLRYHPASDTLTTLNFTLPLPVANMAAAWIGGKAYVFGGCREWGWACNSWDEAFDTIVRVDPVAGTATTLPARLPAGRQASTAVTVGDRAFVLGGQGCHSYYGCDAIVEFDPATGAATLRPERLVASTSAASAFFDGTNIYVVGGRQEPPGRWDPDPNLIMRFTPATGSVVAMSAKLPEPRLHAATVWTGEAGYVFGGIVDASWDHRTDAIFRYDTAMRLPTAPTALSAKAGPGVGEVSLSWREPSHHDDLTLYRVYAADAGGEPELLAEVSGSTLGLVDAGHATGATRDYRVTAVNALGEGPAATISGSTPIIPDAPTGLRVTPATCLGGLDVIWSPPAQRGGAAWGHRVYRSGPEGGETLVDDTGTSPYWPRTYRWDHGLADDSTYTYRVSAYNVVGESAKSEPASATTRGVPSAARTLVATSGPGRGEITLTWQAPAQTWCAPTSYRVYEEVDGVSMLVAETSSPTYTRGGFADGVVGSFVVAPVNRVGEGPTTPTVFARTAVTPGVIANLTAMPGHDAGQVELTWIPPAETGGIAHAYRVYRDGELAAVVPGPTAGFVDQALAPGMPATYEVVVENLVGSSAISDPATGAAAIAPRVDERVAVVALHAGVPYANATVTNGGRVTFVAGFGGSWNPSDFATEGACFDFVRAYHWQMRTGETFDLDLTYDPLARTLTVFVPFDGSTRTCGAEIGDMTHARVDVPVMIAANPEEWEPDMWIRVWA